MIQALRLSHTAGDRSFGGRVLAAMSHQALYLGAVNEAIDDMVHGVPPFPRVRPSLERLSPLADMIVCSATPQQALERESARASCRARTPSG